MEAGGVGVLVEILLAHGGGMAVVSKKMKEKAREILRMHTRV